jgi:hypothetical protein
VLKRPPARQARQLPPSQAIGFAMGRNGSHHIEKVEDDLRPGVRRDADGDKGGKGIAGRIRVYDGSGLAPGASRRHAPCSPSLNSSYASQVTTPPGSRLQHHFMTLHST